MPDLPMEPGRVLMLPSVLERGRLQRIEWSALETYCQLKRDLPDSLKDTRLFTLAYEDLESLIEDVRYYLDSAGIREEESCRAYMESLWGVPQPFGKVFLGVDRPAVLASLNPANSSVFFGWICSQGFVQVRTMVGALISSGDSLAGPGELFTAPYMQDIDGTVRPAWEGGEKYNIFTPDSCVMMAIPNIVWDVVQREAHICRETAVHPYHRQKIRKMGMKIGTPFLPVPKAYHQIDVLGSLRFIGERRRSIIRSAPAWQLMHRQDVRAHWWVKVRQGDGLVPEGFRARFDQDYHWADDSSPDGLDALDHDLLRRRCIEPRRPGQWIGVLRRWVDPYVRGPEDGPYVPASWRVHLPDEGL